MKSIINGNVIFLFLTLTTSLIPLSLLTGPFVPDLILSINSLIFLYLIFKNKEFIYFKNKFFYFFCFFYLTLILSSIFSEFIFNSLKSTFFYFRFYIFSLLIWYLLDNYAAFKKIFTRFLIVTFIFAIFDGYFQFIFGQSIFGYTHGHEYTSRLILSFDDKLILGGYLSRLFPLVIGLILLLYSKRKFTPYLIIFLFISTDILVYLTGERTAFGLMIISSLFLIIFLSEFKIVRVLTLIFSFIIIILVSTFFSDVMERNVNQTISQMGLDKGEIKIHSDHHESQYIAALNMFIENPLLGIGVNNFRELCKNDRYLVTENEIDLPCSTHPHNTYMQLLSETGIVGFILISSICFFITITLLKYLYYFYFKKKQTISNFTLCIYLSFILSLWPLFPTQDLFNNWINVIYYLPLGFFLHMQSITNKKNVDKPN